MPKRPEKSKNTPTPDTGNFSIGKIEQREITTEVKESYLDYAMSVIISRALPDVRDGLKPVHRRILYSMWEQGLKAAARFRKSATIVGAVLGRYHPHGDTAVYDSMVRMAQNFSLRYPLVDGQGNFGSLDGDSAAAYRYCVTEETLVATNKGLLPIREIVSDSKKDEENINIQILSKDKIINRASKWFDSGIHPIIKIQTTNGYEMGGSYNHPLLTWQETTNGGNFVWKTLQEISYDDFVVLDRSEDILWPEKKVDAMPYYPNLENARKTVLPKTINEDLAFILGALVSEGFVGEKKMEFCNADKNFIKEFQAKWHRVFPDSALHLFERKASSYGKKKYERLERHFLNTIAFLKNIGLLNVKSAGKRIPKVILQSPKHVVAQFLQAYFEGDGGTIKGRKRFDLFSCSTSRELLKEIQIVLLRFGILSSGRYDLNRKLHNLFIRGQANLAKFAQEIGFLSERKKQKLSEYLAIAKKEVSTTDFVPYVSASIRSRLPYSEFVLKNNFDRYPNLEKNGPKVSAIVLEKSGLNLDPLFEYLLDAHYVFEKIAKIEKREPARVYSIRVDSSCHSFVANGFINHNTEARLSKIAEELLVDNEKDTVDFAPNFDDTHQEPKVMPAKLPNLLLNGTMGIAVGMATNIPPHNLGEICAAITHLIDNPEAAVADLTEFVKGPDFPTGGLIFNKKEIMQTYATGRGGIVMQAKTEIVEDKAGQYKIIVHEIPYQVNKAALLEKIAELVNEKKIEGIRDIRDESAKEEVRIVIELKKDAYPKKVLNRLFAATQLQETFHVNMLALVDGIQPRVLNLKSVLEYYIKHREEVVRRRTQYELTKARERAHILEGLHLALQDIDRVIAAIKKSQDRAEARKNLIVKFKLTEIQATAILEMRLQQLANLERQKIEQELKEKKELITALESILASTKKILGIIKKEIEDLKNNFADPRRTEIRAHGIKEFSMEDLIPDDPTIIMVTGDGYIKRLPPETFRQQARGGKGVIGLATKEEDVVEQLLATTTHADLLFFTTRGRVFQLKAYDVPPSQRTAKGQALQNFLQLAPGEKISSILSMKEMEEYKFLVMVTGKGLIKKSAIDDFKNVRQSGLIAIKLKDEDNLEWVKPSTGDDEVVIVTAGGQAIHFKEKDVRSMGRAASGTRGIRLKKNDRVVGMDIVSPEMVKKNMMEIFVLSENGLGKRTNIKEYKIQRRGGSGIKTAKVTAKTGKLVAAYISNSRDERDLIIISKKGQVIRLPFASVSSSGRATQGVRLMRFKEEKDSVASVTFV